MSWTRFRRTCGGVLIGAVALAAAGGFGSCDPTKPGPNPVAEFVPPVWESTTVTFFHQQVPASGNATGWVTTVTVPACYDVFGTRVDTSATVSNGTLVKNAIGIYTWTRAVTGAPPVQRVTGTFTANCVDRQGLTAHPTLMLTVT